MKVKLEKETILQFGKFLLVGVANTAVGLGSILILINLLGFQYQIANIIGYALGLTCSFFLNKFFTFRSAFFRPAEIVKFLAAFAISYALQLLTLTLSHEVIKIGSNLSTLIGMAVYTMVNFLLNKFFTFIKTAGKRPHNIAGPP
ncbi:MAG: GtrA family protein [Spirochaetales bacterium]|nr:GtrA family protein [Spirochaetales bacterium]